MTEQVRRRESGAGQPFLWLILAFHLSYSLADRGMAAGAFQARGRVCRSRCARTASTFGGCGYGMTGGIVGKEAEAGARVSFVVWNKNSWLATSKEGINFLPMAAQADSSRASGAFRIIAVRPAITEWLP